MLTALVMTLFTAPGEPPPLFARENVVAWCIVPFDSKRRSPEERVATLKRLGFTKYAYDWRAEHLPTFERELAALQENHIELTAVWFPGSLDADARTILAALKRNGVKTELWVTMSGDGPAKDAAEQRRKVEEHARALRPIAEAAAAIGCSVGLYNHGNWFGEPENQLAILDALKLPNVGIVYNFHHGHDHLDRFATLLQKMKPHLYAINLNGMVRDGERKGRKILPLGQGDLDLGLLKVIAASGYRGPIGILGHTNDDVEERLRDNLDGLEWLLPQLDGKPPGPKPKPRTPVAMDAAPTAAGWVVEGRAEYRTAPLTAEVRFRLRGKAGFNILAASDTKASAAHWELFTWPGNGCLTAYLPGRAPDHVRSTADVVDGKPHNAAMQLEADRVRLFVDGKLVADQRVKVVNKGVLPGGLAFGRLVEGSIGCDGELAWARIAKGVVAPSSGEKPAPVDGATLGLWTFGAGMDQSPFKNNAKAAVAAAPSGGVVPPPGAHLTANVPGLRAVVIDRSDDDAYLGVKVDGAGRLFVGGREAVFVFEPDGCGGFLARQKLLQLPQDSIVIGLEYRGDDLYVQTSNALYLVPGGRVKREGLTLKRLVWGLPQDLHVSFHCLAWGPEGDLYLNHGDPLLNYGDWSRPDHWGHWTLYTQPEGTKVSYTGAGAVLRVHPDGTGLKVVARGLRGPVGLCFDRNWELFTNDNDHESRADLYAPCRLLHVVPHAEFGWPRGWMASKSPDRVDLVEPVNSDMGRGVPCDQWIYDEPMLPELKDNLLLCRWDRMGVTRFPLRPRGASYQAEELPFVTGSEQARPTGIAADRSGRLFVTCHYLAGNVVSPHCVSDLVMLVRDPVPPDSLGDETKGATEGLFAALKSSSGEARRRAHNEILRRRGNVLRAAADEPEDVVVIDDCAAVHRPWLIAAAKGPGAADRLRKVLKSDPRPEMRLQAVRALTELGDSTDTWTAMLDALVDPAPEVRLAAMTYYFGADAFSPFTGLPSTPTPWRENESDPYLLQVGITLLARRGGDLESMVRNSDARTRLVGVAGAGVRLTVPPENDVPPEQLRLSYPEGNAFFHRELRFADDPKPIDLSKLGRVGSYTIAERWKAAARTVEQEKLFSLLVEALNDSDARVKSQAAFYLGLLRDPKAEPLVARATRELKINGLVSLPSTPIDNVWVLGPFMPPDHSRPTETGPVDLAAEYPAAGGGKFAWRKEKAGKGILPLLPISESMTYFYFRLQSRNRQTALLKTSRFAATWIWHNGRRISLPTEEPVLLDLQPGGNDFLISATGHFGLSLSVQATDRLTVDLPEKADASLLGERLRQAGGAAKVGPEFLAVDWTSAARNGDAANGRKLFGSLGCVKCHAIAADQAGGGGPSLADAGKRFLPAALVEAILTPDRQVANDYRATRLVLADGRSLVGLVVKEGADDLELLLPDTTRQAIRKREIEERKVVPGSPMPAGLVRTPTELKDLLAYLLSERPLPP